MIAEFATVPELLLLRAGASGDRPAFSQLNADEHWVAVSWQEFLNRVEATATRLVSHGLEPGDRVGILLPNCLFWEILHHAVLRIGAVVVGLERGDTPDRLAEIFASSQPVAVFAEGTQLLDFLPEPDVNALKLAVTFTSVSRSGWLNWEDFMSTAVAGSVLPPMPQPGQSATIIYTSGTTGKAKGIEYSHAQLAMATRSIIGLYGNILQEQTKFICWLPLTALSQRIANLSGIILAAEVYFLSDPRKIMSVVRDVSPGFFMGVPRFYEKLWQGIDEKVNQSPWPLRRFVRFAIGIGGIHARRVRDGRKINGLLGLTHSLMDRAVLAKIRGVMGHRLRYMVSGSAPIPVYLLEFYHAIGLVVLEAYGLSENIVPMAANRGDSYRFGTVGNVLPQNNIKFDPESTLSVRGPGVFRGYYGDTVSKPISDDLYYDTGDFGELTDGFLSLKGRRAELIKTSTGRRIAPAHVEGVVKSFSLIDQAVVFGSGHKRLIALLTLNPEALAAHDLATHWQEQSPRFLAFLKSGLDAAVAALPAAERPAGYIVLEQNFSVVNGDLTSSQKLRRQNIQQRYASWMDKLFAQVDADDDPAARFEFLFESEIRQAQFLGMPERSDGVSSKLARAARLAWMFVRVGEIKLFDALPHLDLGQASFERRRTAALRKIGRVITTELSILKGPAAKVGQMASYVTDTLPAPIRDSLSKLQSATFPLPNDRIVALVEKSLGRPLDSVFVEWQNVPLAVATMSQVHLARLKTGEQVAVKVLHPDARKMAKSDLQILRVIFPILGKRIGIRNGAEVMKELYDLFVLECDLRREAVHQEIFRRLFVEEENVIIPKVFWQATSQEVLTMEYVSGVSYQQFKAASSQEVKSESAATIFRVIAKAICQYGIFNADPHPGNYIFAGDKICFLDFGFVRRWPRNFIDQWKLQSLAGARGDVEGFKAASIALGFEGVQDFQVLMKQFEAISYEPWRHDRDFRFTPSFINSELKGLFHYADEVGTFRMPPEYVAISRLFSGQYAILSDLGAQANWHRILVPLLQGPTLSLEEVEKNII